MVLLPRHPTHAPGTGIADILCLSGPGHYRRRILCGKDPYRYWEKFLYERRPGCRTIPCKTAGCCSCGWIILAVTSLGGAIGSASVYPAPFCDDTTEWTYRISGAVWNNTLPSRLVENLPDDYKDQASTIFSSIKVAMKYARGTDVRDAIVLSYKQVQRILAIVAFAVMIPNLVLMFVIRDVKLSNDMTLVDHGEDIGAESRKNGVASIAGSVEKRSVEDVKN